LSAFVQMFLRASKHTPFLEQEFVAHWSSTLLNKTFLWDDITFLLAKHKIRLPIDCH